MDPYNPRSSYINLSTYKPYNNTCKIINSSKYYKLVCYLNLVAVGISWRLLEQVSWDNSPEGVRFILNNLPMKKTITREELGEILNRLYNNIVFEKFTIYFKIINSNKIQPYDELYSNFFKEYKRAFYSIFSKGSLYPYKKNNSKLLYTASNLQTYNANKMINASNKKAHFDQIVNEYRKGNKFDIYYSSLGTNTIDTLISRCKNCLAYCYKFPDMFFFEFTKKAGDQFNQEELNFFDKFDKLIETTYKNPQIEIALSQKIEAKGQYEITKVEIDVIQSQQNDYPIEKIFSDYLFPNQKNH